MKNFWRTIKQYVHKTFIFETLLFGVWSIFTIIRAWFIFGRIPESKKVNGPKILIFSVRAFPVPGLIYFETVFGHAFRLLGARPMLIFHDGILNLTDAQTICRSEHPQMIVSKLLGGLMKRALRLPTLSYRSYIKKKEIEEIRNNVERIAPKNLRDYKYLGVNVGIHAFNSTIRYFLAGKLNFGDATQVRIFRGMLMNAILSTLIAKRVREKEKPDTLFLMHGVYSTWGPFYEYFRNQGTQTILHSSMPLKFGYFTFNRNSKVTELVSNEEWERFRKKPLTQKEDGAITEYFAIRTQGMANDQEFYKRNFEHTDKKRELLQALQKKSYTRRYVMYPNLAWDVAIEGEISTIFKDAFDWIDTTIEYFKKHPEYQLIIKPHPAELVWERCTKSIDSYILATHGTLPQNITLLPNSTPLNAYDLIDKNTIAAVFNGTLGFELAILGVPIIVCAKRVHYNQAGAAFPLASRQEYLQTLENPQKLIAFIKQNQPLIRKYAYFHYVKSMIRIPFYRSDIWTTIDWRVMQNTKKLFASDSVIMKVSKRIINHEDIFNPL